MYHQLPHATLAYGATETKRMARIWEHLADVWSFHGKPKLSAVCEKRAWEWHEDAARRAEAADLAAHFERVEAEFLGEARP